MSSPSGQLMDDHRLFLALDLRLVGLPPGKLVLYDAVRAVGNEDRGAGPFVERLYPRRGIDGVADRGVFHFFTEPEVPDYDVPGMKPDADVENMVEVALEVPVEFNE